MNVKKSRYAGILLALIFSLLLFYVRLTSSVTIMIVVLVLHEGVDHAL